MKNISFDKIVILCAAFCFACFMFGIYSILMNRTSETNNQVSQSMMKKCIDATKTPNYKMIEGELYCETPNRNWIKVGESK